MSNLSFTYNIEFSKRKTISIIIERDRKVIVRAPIGTSADFVHNQIIKRKRVIGDKLIHNQKYPLKATFKEFVSGESLLYLGKQYKLLIIDEEIDEVVFDNKFFISTHLQVNANKLLKTWYKSEAEKIIIPRVVYIASKIGVTYNKVNILDLKYRWGSCTPKDKVHFNWRIIKAPMFVIDYIIIHELTHLLEANHTKEFWNRVSVQQPNFTKAKEWLLVNGNELEVDF